jgi:DMSO/TMAO reductase YedYZ molybdopterin-dependent catalytic subunit
MSSTGTDRLGALRWRWVVVALVCATSLGGGWVALAQTRAAAAPPTAPAPSGASVLVVTGAVGQDLRLSIDDLKKMARKSVSTKGHDGEMHEYHGVPIGAVLAKAGVPQGAALRGKTMGLAVVAEGSDGYKAVFSLAELDEDFAGEAVLIVDSTDGKELGTDQGPLRLVAPGDKRQGRWVRMLKSITIVNVGGGAAAAS